MLINTSNLCRYATPHAFASFFFLYFLVTLYNDIINMFIYILRLIGEDRRDSGSNR